MTGTRNVYIRLDDIAHIFSLRQLEEAKHRHYTYKNNPDMKEKIRVEVGSALHWTFCKILEAAAIGNPIPEHDRKRLQDMTMDPHLTKDGEVPASGVERHCLFKDAATRR